MPDTNTIWDDLYRAVNEKIKPDITSQRQVIADAEYRLRQMWHYHDLFKDCMRLLSEGKPIPENYVRKLLVKYDIEIRGEGEIA